jgi:hypothetical protein
MHRRLLPHAIEIAALVLVVVLCLPAAGSARQQTENGTVVIVHGLEGFLADVYLDGSSTPALRGFEYRRVTDPLMLPAGAHRADLRAAGDPPTAPPALSGSFTVTPNQTITVAALLTEDGEPSWIAFANDAPPVAAGSSVLRLRHFAAAEPVTFMLDGAPVLESVSNISEDANVLPIMTTPGQHTVQVVDADTREVLVDAQTVQLADATPEALYLTGKAVPNTLGLLQQSTGTTLGNVEVLSAQVTPTQIAGGNSGLADPRRAADDSAPDDYLLAFGVALVLVVALPLVVRTTTHVRRQRA